MDYAYSIFISFIFHYSFLIQSLASNFINYTSIRYEETESNNKENNFEASNK